MSPTEADWNFSDDEVLNQPLAQDDWWTLFNDPALDRLLSALRGEALAPMAESWRAVNPFINILECARVAVMVHTSL